jgi:hypothetical protein
MPLDCTGTDGVSAADVKRAQQEWANYLGTPVEVSDDIGSNVTMEFVLVPPGIFHWFPSGEPPPGSKVTDPVEKALRKLFPESLHPVEAEMGEPFAHTPMRWACTTCTATSGSGATSSTPIRSS